jgi:hypothetical protein
MEPLPYTQGNVIPSAAVGTLAARKVVGNLAVVVHMVEMGIAVVVETGIVAVADYTAGMDIVTVADYTAGMDIVTVADRMVGMGTVDRALTVVDSVAGD